MTAPPAGRRTDRGRPDVRRFLPDHDVIRPAAVPVTSGVSSRGAVAAAGRTTGHARALLLSPRRLPTRSTAAPSGAGLRVSQAMTSAMLAQREDEAAPADGSGTIEAVAVVADLLHDDCAPWSWSSHSAGYHAGAARRIVRALLDHGWQHEDSGVDAAGPPRPAGIR